MRGRGARVPSNGDRISLRRRSRGDRIRNDGRRAATGARRRGRAPGLVDLGHGRGNDHWDERLEEMHGLPPGGFGGTFEDWVAALHPDDREACIARVSEALEHPSPYVLLHRTTWPDGSLHSIECRGTVLVDLDGQPTGTTGVAIDVTGREELVQTLQQSLLPTALPRVPGVTLTTRYRAAESRTPIGGDWYAAIALPGGRMGVAIGDVAGHGLDAVADMAAARFSLRALALIDSQPDVVLDRLNQVVRVFGNFCYPREP